MGDMLRKLPESRHEKASEETALLEERAAGPHDEVFNLKRGALKKSKLTRRTRRELNNRPEKI